MSLSLQQLFPTAYSPALGKGILKKIPDDFIVTETLSFPFSDEGEHAYLKIRKTGQNTQWVCQRLARHFSVKERDIGYAGLKDRHAITTQWFSFPCKFISDEKIESFAEEGIEILEQQRHSGKLRKGAIKYNQFEIRLHEVDADQLNLIERLKLIQQHGVPNYFDEQRFGRQRQNLTAFNDMVQGKFKPKWHKQRIYISAARSWLFNQVLALRVEQTNWATGLAGDVYQLDGSKKVFGTDVLDEEISQRLLENDIHPTAPLWGAGDLMTKRDALQQEQIVLEDWAAWRKKLEQVGVKQQRRATRVVPIDLEYDFNQEQNLLKLLFKLPSGAYATNLVREIIAV
ncbi:tRNA pseudouridine(13) synthase [hydrothermal vent metagenome]|uniref:tRNA pseudouridine(13) synthase n=1 Tax=hydrothermal vent metagenome TaxID=652676 RepID=A0A3B1AG63_9ZZZZ